MYIRIRKGHEMISRGVGRTFLLFTITAALLIDRKECNTLANMNANDLGFLAKGELSICQA